MEPHVHDQTAVPAVTACASVPAAPSTVYSPGTTRFRVFTVAVGGQQPGLREHVRRRSHRGRSTRGRSNTNNPGGGRLPPDTVIIDLSRGYNGGPAARQRAAMRHESDLLDYVAVGREAWAFQSSKRNCPVHKRSWQSRSGDYNVAEGHRAKMGSLTSAVQRELSSNRCSGGDSLSALLPRRMGTGSFDARLIPAERSRFAQVTGCEAEPQASSSSPEGVACKARPVVPKSEKKELSPRDGYHSHAYLIRRRRVRLGLSRGVVGVDIFVENRR